MHPLVASALARRAAASADDESPTERTGRVGWPAAPAPGGGGLGWPGGDPAGSRAAASAGSSRGWRRFFRLRSAA